MLVLLSPLTLRNHTFSIKLELAYFFACFQNNSTKNDIILNEQHCCEFHFECFIPKLGLVNIPIYICEELSDYDAHEPLNQHCEIHGPWVRSSSSMVGQIWPVVKCIES